jgi:hypothetical protein
MKTASLATALFLLPVVAAGAQSTSTVAALPSTPAPVINLSAQAGPFAAASPGSPPTLTRKQAEETALKNNPRVSVSQLLALAQHQGSAFRGTANGQRSHHRRESPGRQPYLRGNAHRVTGLHACRSRRQLYPTHYRLWQDPQLSTYAKAGGTGGQCHLLSNQGRNRPGNGSSVLRCIDRPGGS